LVDNTPDENLSKWKIWSDYEEPADFLKFFGRDQTYYWKIQLPNDSVVKLAEIQAGRSNNGKFDSLTSYQSDRIKDYEEQYLIQIPPKQNCIIM